MAFINGIWEAATGYIAKVSSAGRLKVDLETDAETNPSQIGGVRLFSENDAGAITGTVDLLSPESSQDYRLRVGVDTLLFTDAFNASTQNTSLWSYTFATMTAAQPGAGTVNFGVVQGTTSAHGSFMRTFQYFPVIGTAPIAVEFTFGQFTAALVANEVWLMGLGIPTAAVAETTEGVFFRLTTAGLIGELRYSGVATQTGALRTLAQITAGQLYKATIVIGEREVSFWLDDIKLGSIAMPAGNGQPFQQSALPAFMMKYNTGAVASTNTMRVADLTVTLLDIATNNPWAHQLCGAGQMGHQGQNGHTMGTTALLPNAAGATTITGGALSQTVTIATGLGGQAGIQAAAAGIDGCVTAYQNPSPTINITGRNLVISGIRIDAVNLGAAVATTATIIQWSLAYGATGGTIPSLAQAESASFATATAKSWRRVALGMSSWLVGDGIGKAAQPIVVTFDNPIVIQPGQWVAAVAKFIVGTATASQVAWCTVTFDPRFE
jgi:hypothetical protein